MGETDHSIVATAAVPLVSVIIPTHNRPQLLAEALASVRAQTFTDYEIIVVSNGEQDPFASRRVAAHYGCRFITLTEGNRSLARNVAIGQARGEWIAFLDDDDLWDRDKLAFQVAFAADTGADCIFTDFILYDVRTGAKRKHAIGPVNARVCKGLTIAESFMIWRAGTGGCSTVLSKRHALLALGGFDQNMTLVEDWDMWRRLSQRYRIAYLDKMLSTLRTHSINGEAHAVLRPWFCTYWEVYHAVKTICGCPPELRHMIPGTIRYIAKRVLFWHPIFVVAGMRIAGRRPFEPLFDWGRPYYRRIIGNELAAFRQWLRPRRRLNALFGREIFLRLGEPPDDPANAGRADEGRIARRAGVILGHNPYRGYRQHEHLADQWEAGWKEAANAGPDHGPPWCRSPRPRRG